MGSALHEHQKDLHVLLQDKREIMERVRWGEQCCNKDDKTGMASFSFLSGKIRSRYL